MNHVPFSMPNSKDRPPGLTVRWMLACLLSASALAAHASGGEPLLKFAPYALNTQRDGAVNAEVAFLEVPRRRDQPEGARMKLRVVRLPATGGNRKAAPVVYLAGGPGGSGVGTARGPRWPVFEQVQRETDVLLFDQRGTGLSDPPPPCPYTARFDDARPLDHDTALATLRRTAARCIAYWQKEGVELAAYTTAESAADLEDLRRALGEPRISLWGMSYGTHLALATLRLHGAGIERVVLMGVEGPDHTLKLPMTADAVLAELAIVAKEQGFDDLVGITRRVLDKLSREPGEGRSLMHKGRRVTVGAFDAQLAIAAALGRRSTQQMLPLALRDAEAGNYDLMATLVLSVREQLGQFQAMPLAMDVASGQSPQRRAMAQAQAKTSLFGDALNFPFPAVGDSLGLVDLGEAYRAPLKHDVEALFVSGTLDGRTPPGNAQALLPGFANGVHLLVREASHDDELWLGNASVAERIARFLGGQKVEGGEVRVLPPDLAHGKLGLLMQALNIGGGTVALVLLALSALLAGAVALIRRSRRARRRHLQTGSLDG
ncbi:alpha/beta fold hydrolase [uncultured Stenotrophomonas sp.]|uniref:alpha/beta hydrolase n=1 Tax=uncultured Stenotrophomonas sp. TaxID=165438 RepID=UPI0028EFA841|nr:alpha/beta fold hydrolase [uncultured Stenotrophomonas sp.]